MSLDQKTALHAELPRATLGVHFGAAIVTGLVLTGAAVAVEVAVAVAPYRSMVSGGELVRDMLGDPDDGLNAIRRERAMGYIDGVMDAEAGKGWCPAGKAVSHEENYIVIDAMRGLSAKALRGGAASLIVAALQQSFPCGRRKQ